MFKHKVPKHYITKNPQDGTGVISNIKDFIQGRPSDMYPPQIRKFIEVYSNHKVENVMVARKPVLKVLEYLVNTFLFLTFAFY